VTEGQAGIGGPRVAILLPQTFMNESGRSAGPARGKYKVPLERVVVIHDEIDLPFGEVRDRIGGGLAGHNGLKSLKQHLGSGDFLRVRVGVGRPDSTDPDEVAAYVLSRFPESPEEVRALVQRAADRAEELVRAGGA
jgi:PTH1 family peptidyl-tRNA hydrolase